MFTAEQRAGYLGASDMSYVMNRIPPEQLLKWWECKVGLRDPDPPSWAMRLGSLVGDAIVDEYARQTGNEIVKRQEVVPSPVNKRFRSTLDGYDIHRNAVIEAKFASPFFDREQIFATYYPQVAMQMHCTDASCGYLVIAQGTSDPFDIECVREAAYEAVLLERAAAMLLCIDTLTPPVAIISPSIVPPEKWRTVDLEREDPNWRDEMIEQLVLYHDTRDQADANDAAGKAAKALVPDDVGKVLVGGYAISRNKKGTLVITARRIR